jgi:hypothetical protein
MKVADSTLSVFTEPHLAASARADLHSADGPQLPSAAARLRPLYIFDCRRPEMTWLGKLMADARGAEIEFVGVTIVMILSGPGLLLSLVAALTFGLNFPASLF